MKPKALILQARGTNRDLDVMDALTLAGADAIAVPLNELRRRKTAFQDFQLLVLPGGFSYADALGAGKLLALDLSAYFADEIHAFVDSGKPMIGICNGFQALIKSGVFSTISDRIPSMTLTFNACGHFECRWVTLMPSSQKCVWTKGLDELVTCPVAHGEGRFEVSEPFSLLAFKERGQIALTYVHADGLPAEGMYPANPNGSRFDVAGICNLQGNVLGLMPHPENHVHDWQNPRHTRGEAGRNGLKLFENGVEHARQM